MNASGFSVCIVLLALVPLTIAGYVLIQSGFAGVRGAGFAIFSGIVVTAVAAIVFCVFGCSLEGHAGGSSHSVMVGGVAWNWIATQPLFMGGMKGAGELAAVLQLFTVAFAALIPLSAGADRWKLRSVCISTVLFAGISYPLFAHWVWGGGWLSTSTLFGGHGFIDPGGASTIHVLGGLSALTIAWILGPRRGKYLPDGRPAAIPGHNMVYVLFGCALLLPGWIALNSLGAMLFADVTVFGLPLVMANTLICATAACLVAVVVTRVRFLKPDVTLCANAWVGGLVASSAVCCSVSPLGALLTGIVAGLLVTLTVELIEAHLSTDDPGGAISVHAVAGIWGLLAAAVFPLVSATNSGLFAQDGGPTDRVLAQIVGIATLLGVMLPLSYGMNWLLNFVDPQRIERQHDRKGMDIQELGAVAYPDFVIHPES